MKSDTIAIFWAEVGAVVIALCLFLQHHFNTDIFWGVILISGSFLLFYFALTKKKKKEEIELIFKIKLQERDIDLLWCGGLAILSFLLTRFLFREFWYIW